MSNKTYLVESIYESGDGLGESFDTYEEALEFYKEQVQELTDTLDYYIYTRLTEWDEDSNTCKELRYQEHKTLDD